MQDIKIKQILGISEFLPIENSLVIITLIILLLILSGFNSRVFAQDNKDALEDLIESQIKKAKHFENNAKWFVNNGEYESASIEYEHAAEKYSEAARYYEQLGDFWNAAEVNGMASLAHEEASFVYYNLENFELQTLNWLLSKQYKAKSLNQKGIYLFGKDYMLPSKHQKYLVDDPKDIICKPGLELIFKTTDDSPACVKPQNITKLIQRGWARK